VEFAAKYQQLTVRGKHHFVAVVALANILARRAYALLKRRANGPAHYERRDTTGQAITRQQARAQVQRDYPTKREQERRKQEAPATAPQAGPERAQKREGSTPVSSGQPKGSTTRMPSASRHGQDATELPDLLERLLERLEASRATFGTRSSSGPHASTS
jgi:hypothetical protein